MGDYKLNVLIEQLISELQECSSEDIIPTELIKNVEEHYCSL